MYRVFDILLSCDFPLPGLVSVADGQPDIRVETISAEPLDLAGFEMFYEWRDSSGSTLARYGRREDAYRLEFPGMMDFLVFGEGRLINLTRAPGIPDETVAHLLLDQVIPRVLGLRGRVLIHASAVTSSVGHAFVFVGPSGRGKSTLAASFYQDGWRVLTDDCIQLDIEGERVLGTAAYPSIRLWSESSETLFGDSSAFVPVVHYSSKKQLLMTDASQPPPERQRISALFVLDDADTESEDIVIRPIGGLAAAKAMIESAFVLDTKDRVKLEQWFRGATTVVRTGLPMFKLVYPRRFDHLDEVRRRVVEAAGE
jgi:hypothetical protein